MKAYFSRRHTMLAAVVLLLWVEAATAQTIHYSIAMPQPASHLFQVEITIDQPGVPDVDLALPAWNALYQIRDFSQFVQDLHANVPFARLDKQTWRFDTRDSTQLKASYAVFANEWSSFSSELNERHAFINSADLLMLWTAARRQPVELRLAPPSGWQVSTSLPAADKPFTYRAESYDHLVDCPIDAGRIDTYSFAVDSVRFTISVDGSHRDYDKAELVSMVEQIVRAEVALFGEIPFRQYTFIYHFDDLDRGGGGMEHADSTAIHVATRHGVKSVREAAGVTAHEFFHAWNVKRIRPQGLEPVDYFKENYTSALWFSEGVTSYYGDLLLKRAGLWNRQQYLDSLSDEIRTLQSRPARRTQSAAQSSLMTWYDKYPYYQQPGQSISYYNKGELIGLLLDLKIRDATGNQRSLDTVLRHLNENFAQKGRFFEDDYGIAEAIQQATGVNLDAEYRSWVHSTDELPYADILRLAGLEWNGERLRELPNASAKQRQILESWLTGK
jgi:predicted metalloprotease with PDZ domain